MGKVVGDSIQCPYHGLRFEGSGQSPWRGKYPQGCLCSWVRGC
jgi:phenylpropionate dioxygenase-like ring-hydroxylating dioxygenase large terminal subunit